METLLILAMISSHTTLGVSSTAFKNNEMIPQVYSCEGKEVNPPLAIDNIPDGTKSLVLIVDDPDTDHGTFVHWVQWNIKPATKMIKENSSPGMAGLNGAGEAKYKGMCPPTGKHRYFFKVYALDTELSFASAPDKKKVEEAMTNHIIAQGELIGLYTKGRK